MNLYTGRECYPAQDTGILFTVKTMAQPDSNRFQSDAGRYAAYLESPEGRLRLDLAFANLQDFFGPFKDSLRALDIGCGTGAMAIRLARLGCHVTLLDSSQAMLDRAQLAAQEAGFAEKITLKVGDVAHLISFFPNRSFDVIACHNVLEYVDDPGAVLRGAATLLRDSSALLSILVRSQAGEVLKTAIQAGDLAAAEDTLASEWTRESLYGGNVRLFTFDQMRGMLKAASLEIMGERGVRIVADYLPSKISRTEEYERILELERKLSSRSEFTAAARYTQFLARVAAPARTTHE